MAGSRIERGQALLCALALGYAGPLAASVALRRRQGPLGGVGVFSGLGGALARSGA